MIPIGGKDRMVFRCGVSALGDLVWGCQQPVCDDRLTAQINIGHCHLHKIEVEICGANNYKAN